jgi:hypothetical protein
MFSFVSLFLMTPFLERLFINLMQRGWAEAERRLNPNMFIAQAHRSVVETRCLYDSQLAKGFDEIRRHEPVITRQIFSFEVEYCIANSCMA